MRPALDTTKYAIVYPRQSSGEQVRENVYSLDRQLALKERAIADGFPDDLIIVVDDDLGMSGRSIDKRPGFTRALKMIEQGVVGALYAEDQTRLSRDERTIDHMRIADACERGGTLIYMGASWYDMRDSGQRQSFKYQAVGGSEYWKAHLEKLREAQRRKAKMGKAVAAAPRGYRVNKEGAKRDPDRDRLVPFEPEAAVIRALVEQLPEAGSVMGLYKKLAPLYWPDGVEIKYDALHRCLTEPVYRGTYVWGDVRVEGAHEPIITPDQVTMIDQVVAYNRQAKRRPSCETGAELMGLIWCGVCGRKMAANRGGHSPHYRCQATADGIRVAGGYHFSVDIDHVDRAVRLQLFDRLAGGLIEGIISNIQAERARAANADDGALNQRRVLERKIQGWMNSLGDPELPETVRKMIQGQMEEAIKQLADADRPRPAAGLVDDTFYRDLRRDPEHLNNLTLAWADEPLQWRRLFVRRFVERVELAHNDGGLGVAITWLDGATTTADVSTRAWAQAEIDLLRSLCEHPECPQSRLGRLSWLYERFTAHGYQRPRLGVRRMLIKLDLLTPTNPRPSRHGKRKGAPAISLVPDAGREPATTTG